MKKKIFLLLLSAFVFVTGYAQTQSQQISLLEKAEIVGVENEFYLINDRYAGIKLRNPFSYNVSVVVEFHRTAVTDDGRGLWDQIILKKYVVLGPREEYEIPTYIYVERGYMERDFICHSSPSYASNFIYYTDIKAYKASVFQ